MDYQLIFVIKEYRHNKITTILNFCFIGMTVGLVVGILSKAIFDIILYPLMYFTFSCMFIGKILREIGLKKDIGKLSLCTDGSILITAKEKELILDTSDVKEIVIHYHQSYDGRGDIGWYNHNSVSIIPGDDNTIKITSKEGKIFNYFFLSEYKEDLGYLNELVSHWKSIGINVVFTTTNEKHKTL